MTEDGKREFRAALGIFGATLLAFAPGLAGTFVDFDDFYFVAENPVVRQGLGLESILWAFSTGLGGNYVPVAWLSHLVDVQIFGLWAPGHRATSLLLHALNGALVLLLFRRMTGSLWRSAAVAVLFALHPLRVESVTWISERRDVLFMSFGLLSMLAYVRYARQGCRRSYGVSLGLFALSLLSKSTLVTLPFLLVLLDAWPLKRATLARPRWREKIPYLLLCLAIGLATLYTQRTIIAEEESLPLALRVGNAVVAYVVYLRQTVWPSGLAILYLHPGALPPSVVGASAALLAAISWLAVRWRDARPWLFTGWLWYLGTLLPMIGLVQVGVQAHADRYTYFPSLGLAWIAAWAVPERWLSVPHTRRLTTAGVGLVCSVLALATAAQTRHWRDGIALFERARAVTRDNFMAERHLGVALARYGRHDEAVAHLEEALRLRPAYAEARYDLALSLRATGRTAEARRELERALEQEPGWIEARSALGALLAESGDTAGALRHLEAAVRAKPDDPGLLLNLGLALARAGDGPGAETRLREAVRLAPDSADARHALGFVLASRGNMEEAARELEEALRLAPDHAPARADLQRLRARRAPR